MKKISISLILSTSILLGPLVQASSDKAKRKNKKKSQALTQREILQTVENMEHTKTSSSRSKRKKNILSSLPILEMESYFIEKISKRLFQVVTSLDDKSNSVFQTKISQLQKQSEKLFNKKIPEYGLASRSEEQNSKHFALIWKKAINDIYEIEVEAEKEDNSEFDLLSDDEKSDEEENQTIKKIAIKTTLLNLLLRREKSNELVEKVQTLIENGCNKNLHEEFSNSPKMENQKEYPMSIILNEIKNGILRKKFTLGIFKR